MTNQDKLLSKLMKKSFRDDQPSTIDFKRVTSLGKFLGLSLINFPNFALLTRKASIIRLFDANIGKFVLSFISQFFVSIEDCEQKYNGLELKSSYPKGKDLKTKSFIEHFDNKTATKKSLGYKNIK